MAAKFDVPCSKGDLFTFDPKDIVIKPNLNGRAQLPDIEDLIADIVDKGQLEPIIIRKEDELPVLVAGFSRWRAICEINKRKLVPGGLKIRCIYSQCSELDGFLMNISENLVRNKTTDLDDAYNVQRLEKWLVPHEKIAAIYHKPESWVKKCLKIASCEPEVLKAVKDGRLKINAAAGIAKLSSDLQREKVAGEGPVEVVKVEKLKCDKKKAAQLIIDAIESSEEGPHRRKLEEIADALGFEYGKK